MIFGTGLIGGSVGMALRDRGWQVSGVDAADGVAARAVELGALSDEGVDHRADLVVVATPVHAAGEIIAGVLASAEWNPEAVVTDVGRVKGPLVAAVDHPSLRRRPPDGRLRAGGGGRRLRPSSSWAPPGC